MPYADQIAEIASDMRTTFRLPSRYHTLVAFQIAAKNVRRWSPLSHWSEGGTFRPCFGGKTPLIGEKLIFPFRYTFILFVLIYDRKMDTIIKVCLIGG